MIIKKIEEFEENGYTILEDVIPQNEVQLLNIENLKYRKQHLL